VPEFTELERDLRVLEASLRKLEIEYGQFFAGQLPRPPWELRTRVETLIRRYDRAFIQNAVHRFRLSTLQSRYSTFVELWDRALRAREEGRPGPLFRTPRPTEPIEPAKPEPPSGDHLVATTTLADPGRETEKLEALYDSFVEARRAVGNEETFPYHRFVQIVKTQVSKLQDAGSSEVAFRVAVKEGKVAFSAKGVRASDAERKER
jgi:hypothetical protein